MNVFILLRRFFRRVAMSASTLSIAARLIILEIVVAGINMIFIFNIIVFFFPDADQQIILLLK